MGVRAPAIQRTQRLRGSILAALSLVLLSYTVLRAITVSFSWDESWTFMHHVRRGVLLPAAFDQMGANHHLFNVWGMWVCWKLFGASELALRVPNLLAQVFYLYAGARLVFHARNTALAVGCFLLLNAHPYLLDFFSLARGYGLACAALMLALWQAWRYMQEGHRLRHLIWGTVFAVIAVMASLVMLSFLLAYAGALVLYVITARPAIEQRGRHIIICMVITAFGAALSLPLAFALRSGGSLYFGADSLWEGSVRSLAEKWLYHRSSEPLAIVQWVLLTFAAWIALCLLLLWKVGNRTALRAIAFGVAVLLLVLVSMGLQHGMLGVPWPRSRTTLFLVPLTFFVLVTSLLAWPGRAWVNTSFTLLCCIPLLDHGAHCINDTYCIEWRPSGEARRMLGLIVRDHIPLTPQRPIVTVSASFESLGCIPYYRADTMTWMAPNQREPDVPFVPSDYYIVEYDAFDRVDTVNWTLLYHAESTNASLYRDERLRAPVLKAFQGWDLEDADLPGRCTSTHMSGVQCVRFDSITRAVRELVWTVPENWKPGPVLVCGTARAMQHDDTNWLTLLLTWTRNGTEVMRRDESTVPQVRVWDAWAPTAVTIRLNDPLQPGDEVHFSVRPQGSYPPLYADDLALWVMQ